MCRSKHVEPLKNFGIINSTTKLHLVGISTEYEWVVTYLYFSITLQNVYRRENSILLWNGGRRTLLTTRRRVPEDSSVELNQIHSLTQNFLSLQSKIILLSKSSNRQVISTLQVFPTKVMYILFFSPAQAACLKLPQCIVCTQFYQRSRRKGNASNVTVVRYYMTFGWITHAYKH